MKRQIFGMLRVASAALFVASSSAAIAQSSGSVTANAFAIGLGPGTTGYASLLCGSAQLAVGQSAAKPICQSITGDVTISASGVTAIGSNKVTLAMLATGTQDTALGYWGSTAVSGNAIPNCSGGLTYNTSTHLYGCNTSGGTGTVTQVNTAGFLSGGPITTTGTISAGMIGGPGALGAGAL